MGTMCKTLDELYEMTDEAFGNMAHCAEQLGRWMDSVDINDHCQHEINSVSQMYGMLLLFMDRWKTCGFFKNGSQVVRDKRSLTGIYSPYVTHAKSILRHLACSET